VEKKDEETARKRIEEQLSEAMIRECWKCRTKYFKEEGCNKMTCPKPGCGAKMCYLCKQPVKDYTHFYGQGGAPTASKTCPLWTDNKRLHEQEVANAAAKAKEEMAAQNPHLTLKHDPTKGIAMPAHPMNLEGQAPDLAEVIAPGVPREEIVRQQRYIEAAIRGGPGLAAGHLRFLPHLHRYNPPQPGGFPDGFIARMGEILHMREQNRANLRVVRQREAQAMRELQRANHLMPVGPPFGIPQAVPEPAPFLDLVEAQGRNIQVVQQQRVPQPHYFPAAVHGAQLVQQHQHLLQQQQQQQQEEQRHRANRRAALQEEDRLRGEREAAEQRRREERRQRHEHAKNHIREQLESTRRRARRLEQEERTRVRQQQVTAEQRERAARSREEAVRRLDRNREEVLRRQRRAEQGGQAEQAGDRRQFNFQEILDLDALNPDYL
jgi:hypothetical protein